MLATASKRYPRLLQMWAGDGGDVDMDNVTALSEYIIGTRDTLRQVAFLYRYRRRLAKGFKSFLHLRVVNVGIDHGGGESAYQSIT